MPAATRLARQTGAHLELVIVHQTPVPSTATSAIGPPTLVSPRHPASRCAANARTMSVWEMTPASKPFLSTKSRWTSP